jgi:hypothetical protein
MPGQEFLQRQVERRKNRDYPAPTLALYDQLLATPWSEAFRDQLEFEERVAADEAGPNPCDLQEPAHALFALTPYVNVMEDAKGRQACVCVKCGHVFGEASQNYKLSCLVCECNPEEVHGPLAPDADWLIFREFYCSGCGTQVEVESTPSCMPVLHDIELNELL